MGTIRLLFVPHAVMPTDFEPSRELIASAMAGSEEARDELCRLLGERVKRHVRRFARNDEAARDLSQDVWLKVFKCLHTYDGRGKFGGWIMSIATNTCINSVKSGKRSATVPLDCDLPIPPELSPELLLLGLAEEDQFIARRLFEGDTPAEIAVMSVKSADHVYRRIREHIRPHLVSAARGRVLGS